MKPANQTGAHSRSLCKVPSGFRAGSSGWAGFILQVTTPHCGPGGTESPFLPSSPAMESSRWESRLSDFGGPRSPAATVCFARTKALEARDRLTAKAGRARRRFSSPRIWFCSGKERLLQNIFKNTLAHCGKSRPFPYQRGGMGQGKSENTVL